MYFSSSENASASDVSLLVSSISNSCEDIGPRSYCCRCGPARSPREAMKWLLAVAMIVFVITISDRAVEFLTAASVILGTPIRALFERSSEKPA